MADLAEIVELAAYDHELFGHTFFPDVVRDPFPAFADEMWNVLENPNHHLANFQLFRGSSKTTTLRLFNARRIAYGVSHVIVYIAVSKPKALESTIWIKTQIEENTLFAQTFGLEPGKVWQDGLFQINHTKLAQPIWVMGFGITGPIRGILTPDNRRPDLINADDVVSEENSNTPEMREKISNLVFGALLGSLAPQTEIPNSKMVITQTPLDFEDVSTQALKDPQFKSVVQGCWTHETEEMPTEHQESVWPERFPSETLRGKKLGFVARNKTSVWMREYECRLVSPETSAFRPDALQFFDEAKEEELARSHPVTVIAIDPVPPPSDREVAKGLHGKDYECLAVWSYHRGGFYQREYVLNRGHDPNWTINQFFRLRWKYRPRKLVVETVAYQRTLKWLLSQAMKKQGQYTAVEDWPPKGMGNRSKYDTIVDAFSGPASHGQIYVRSDHHEFVTQWANYPNIRNDDLINTGAIAVSSMNSLDLYEGDDYTVIDEAAIPALNYGGAAP